MTTPIKSELRETTARINNILDILESPHQIMIQFVGENTVVVTQVDRGCKRIGLPYFTNDEVVALAFLSGILIGMKGI